ncbi:MAG: glutamate-5-semialdehyde dehydrogenase [Acidobacteriota bacterium]|nr:glutamate-5-semialdehyde dehydrogenase [Acidobacteriota bacterium]
MKAEFTKEHEDVASLIRTLGERARTAYRVLAKAETEQKNAALQAAAENLRTNESALLAANAEDVEATKQKQISNALLDRLLLNPARIEAMATGLEQIAALPDPAGKTLAEWERPNGLKIRRMSVPLGVIGIIYESRPNVTADAGGLCLKSGNAVILRGGSESLNSSKAITACLHAGLKSAALPVDAIQLVPIPDRAAVGQMLTLTDLIDVIIPRGGKSLTERILNESRVPTILHLDGNCHTYFHASAKPEMAKQVLLNAKLRRTGICGATESLLVDRAAIQTLLPEILEALFAAGCEVRGDETVQTFDERVAPAQENDWSTEYLDTVLSVKVVSDVSEAIAHINFYGSHHTDAIIAEDKTAAAKFLSEVDSAIVLHNASTQFADGGEFGMGAEIGISTGRLHARGPVGVEQLTTYKYVVLGNGQIRS